MIYAYAKLTVTNPDALAEYRDVAGEALAKHGGKVESATGAFTVLDGAPDAPNVAALLSFPNKEAAMDFLVHASAPEQQAGQAKYINYGPMRASAFEIMKSGEPWFHNGKNIMEHMPNRPEVMARSVFANPEWWADNGDEVNERFKAWMAK